jgi:SAM-dependent methyltransferase
MGQIYSSEFFEQIAGCSSRSAHIIVPIFLNSFPARSVVDVGCGEGSWLSAFMKAGINDVTGIDGDYVPREALKIPFERFRSADLATLTDLGRHYDVAVSLEVAEHLREEVGPQFVLMLTKAAPVVLFSAAIPGQGGIHHVNEQWQSYWAGLFREHGYVAVDPIRPVVWGNRDVAPWYRQNTLVYCRPDRVPAGHTAIDCDFALNRVDPEIYLKIGGKEAVTALGQAILRRVNLRR